MRPPIRPGDNLLDQVAFIFGDPQLDAAPGWDRINQATGRSTRFDETATMLKATAREAWDAGARVMIMLGDATEYKDPGSVVLAVLADVFADWISWGGGRNSRGHGCRAGGLAGSIRGHRLQPHLAGVLGD